MTSAMYNFHMIIFQYITPHEILTQNKTITDWPHTIICGMHVHMHASTFYSETK